MHDVVGLTVKLYGDTYCLLYGNWLADFFALLKHYLRAAGSRIDIDTGGY